MHGLVSLWILDPVDLSARESKLLDSTPHNHERHNQPDKQSLQAVLSDREVGNVVHVGVVAETKNLHDVGNAVSQRVVTLPHER